MKMQLHSLALLALALAVGLPTHAKDVPGAPAESKPQTSSPQTTYPSPSNPVDLNRASKVDLKRLPGIGEKEANLIISARPFRSKAELVTRNLITEEHYSKLRKLVAAKNPPMPKLPERSK